MDFVLFTGCLYFLFISLDIFYISLLSICISVCLSFLFSTLNFVVFVFFSSLKSSIKPFCFFFSLSCVVSVRLCCDTCLLNEHQRHRSYQTQIENSRFFLVFVEFLLFAIVVLLIIKHKYVLHNIVFHSHLPHPHLYALVPFVLSTPEDALFAASVPQLHTANVA